MMMAVVKNIISRLFFAFQISDKFLVATLHEILEQLRGKRFSLEGHQILLFDVHVVHRTPKVSFSRRITEDDGEKVARSLHSSVQLLYSIIKTIVLCRSGRRCVMTAKDVLLLLRHRYTSPRSLGQNLNS